MTGSGRNPDPAFGFASRFKWRVGAGGGNLRLDRAVSEFLRTSRDEAEALIEFGSVYVDGRGEGNPARLVSGGEEISVNYPPGGIRKYYELDPARIVFRDRFLLAYDKEAGIPSQQVPHDGYNNVFAALLRYLRTEGEEDSYAALHHRLDRETSGLMLFALQKGVNNALGRTFQEKRIEKEYLAWVEGRIDRDSWMTDSDIGKIGSRYSAVPKGQGKRAQTRFKTLHREESGTLVLASPLTGRTHQIRIHLALEGHPILGDRMYGAKPDSRLYLHAYRLTLKHPATGKPLRLSAPVPSEWPVPEGLLL